MVLEQVCILSGGDIHKLIVDGKTHWMEFHPFCGPCFWADAQGKELKNQPSERNKVWRAVELWCKQGKCVDDAGVCVWEEPPPRYDIVRRWGRACLIIGEVLPDGTERFFANKDAYFGGTIERMLRRDDS